MELDEETLDFSINGCPLRLSARRLWEHTTLGQINPFLPVTPKNAEQPECFVDVIEVSVPYQVLTGLTLSDAMKGVGTEGWPASWAELLRQAARQPVRRWLALVRVHLLSAARKRLYRNMPAAFLPATGASALGVQGIKCALPDWLIAHAHERADARQWCARVRNLANNGLRADELAHSGLEDGLLAARTGPMNGAALAAGLDYRAVRLSILPVVRPSSSQLDFMKVDAAAPIRRIKPKVKGGLTTRPSWRDRVLGYWIDQVEWSDLLGTKRGWVAFTHRGELVTGKEMPGGLCPDEAAAMRLAGTHARTVFPKLSAQGDWSSFRMTGGVDYREWLVTLPFYRPSFFSSHFDHRNVLLHVRCDIRDGANGQRILVLQEVQSDWVRHARRDHRDYGTEQVPQPPWLQEWPALALKLMLLHAARIGADALAWTPGRIQEQRYDGLGREGLLDLYDRILPVEASRLLRRHGRRCVSVEAYQPVNFRMEPADTGYAVWDDQERFLGTFPTPEEALETLPDGAHEKLQSLHGIPLDRALRTVLQDEGFFAWGAGVR